MRNSKLLNLPVELINKIITSLAKLSRSNKLDDLDETASQDVMALAQTCSSMILICGSFCQSEMGAKAKQNALDCV